jgi:CRP-like cAMP-binding protein
LPQTSPPIRNAILNRLPPADREKLGPLERVSIALRQPLELANTANEFVYFIEAGLASVVWEISTEGSTEIGLVGWEGMTGLGIVYGDTQTPFETFMQIEGAALRCETERLRSVWEESAVVRAILARYARAFTIQSSATAVVNGRYNLEQRLARWMLMVSDRMGHNFNITHDFIAVMLAVRRPGVTLAIQSLEGRSLIRATRGAIQIIDRAGLIAFAKGAYGLPEREYERLWAQPQDQLLTPV